MGDAGTQQEQVALAYLGDFAARTDAYADWDDRDPDREKHHWYLAGRYTDTPEGPLCEERYELTVDRAIEGLRGGKPISTYMETASGSTHLGAVDFDRDDGWDQALRVADMIAGHGGAPVLERSRNGERAHLWVVLDDLVFGGEARLALREFCRLTDPALARDRKVEILPKRLEHRDPESVGSPLRMPLMRHQRTGRRFPLCDAQGEPLGTSVTAMVAAVPLTPAKMIREVAWTARVPVSEAHIPEWARRPPRPGGDVIQILTAAGVPRANPGRSVRCPLHDDRVASLAISRDGERVWCKSPECLAYNNGRGFGADQLAQALGSLVGA